MLALFSKKVNYFGQQKTHQSGFLFVAFVFEIQYKTFCFSIRKNSSFGQQFRQRNLQRYRRNLQY
jgi:hypothetical protein